MSVKHALLALLSRGPSTTYQLRRDFDVTTSQTWPLNIGQVSTTLQRLQRDGLVLRAQDSESEGAAAEPWQITQEGRAELDTWWLSPISREHRGRDELVVKLALAVSTPGVDVPALVQLQRLAAQQLLHDLTRLRRGTDATDTVSRLVLDSHIFQAEADLRWLDAVEGELARASANGSDRPSSTAASAPTGTPAEMTR